MVSMDVKDFTWVGHVYQQFEAMCLEVEELVYKDTVQYVENQVENVGASVKKFYSDVMEDLLSPVSKKHVKIAFQDLPTQHYDEVDTYRKPKSGTKEEEPSFDKKNIKVKPNVRNMDEVVSNSLPLIELCHVDYSSDTSMNTFKEAFSGGNYKHCNPIGKRSIGNSDLGLHVSDAVNPLEKDMSQAWSFCEVLEDMPNNNEGISLAESLVNYKEVNVSDPGRQCNLQTDAIEIEQTDKAYLERSCVIVNGDELKYVPSVVDKHKPYQKKICDAFSLRKRSARKQEYEQIAIQYNEKSNKSFTENSTPTLALEDVTSQSELDVGESEWVVL